MPQSTESRGVVDVTTDSFEREVLQSAVPVVVDFWAPWCIYCKKLAPIYEASAPKWAGKVKLAKVNVDQERALSERFGIMSLPTLKWFCGGREVGESVGYVAGAELERILGVMETHAVECMKNSSAVT